MGLSIVQNMHVHSLFINENNLINLIFLTLTAMTDISGQMESERDSPTTNVREPTTPTRMRNVRVCILLYSLTLRLLECQETPASLLS